MASTPQSCETTLRPTVFVVDDDVSVRDSLELLIRDAGWRTEVFASAQAFLAYPRVQAPACLILDMSLPDLHGLEIQRRVAQDRRDIPIIFITGYRDVPTTVRAMKAGAFEFLTKPFVDDELLEAIRRAVARSQAALREDAQLQALRDRLRSLTQREREVLELVASGNLNKQVAAALDISVITVKAHRGSMMRKMAADSFADLVRMVEKLALGVGSKA